MSDDTLARRGIKALQDALNAASEMGVQDYDSGLLIYDFKGTRFKAKNLLFIEAIRHLQNQFFKNWVEDDDDGERRAEEAMERGISRAETSYEPDAHDFDPDPQEPERPHDFGVDDDGKRIVGFLATCEECGLATILSYPHYSHRDIDGWTCWKSEDEEKIKACRDRARVLALKADVPAMEYEEDRAERASGFGAGEFHDYGGE